MVDSPQAIPSGSASGWDALVAGWGQLNASLAATFRPTGNQDAFLRTVGLVIDETERITLATETGDSYPYREARPTAGSRSGATRAWS